MLKGMARYFPTKRQDLFNLKKDSIYPYSLLQVIINNLDLIEMDSKRMFSTEQESDDDESFDQGDEEDQNDKKLSKMSQCQKDDSDDEETKSFSSAETTSQDEPQDKPSSVALLLAKLREQHKEKMEKQKKEDNKSDLLPDKEFFIYCIDKEIRTLTKREFNRFVLVLNKYEQLMIEKLSIIVTTCKAAKSIIFKKVKFTRVIIDEATQSHELETLETIMQAE
jgi:hypothetical protein